MATADTKSDEQVLKALDFQYKEPCVRPTCPMAATFVIQCRHCGDSVIVCTTHFLETKHYCDNAGIVICLRCKGHGHSFEQLCRVIPIGAH